MLERMVHAVSGSWTTVGLQKGIRALATQVNQRFDQVFAISEEIKAQMKQIQDHFVIAYGFSGLRQPRLDLDPLRRELDALVRETDRFCRDPVNIMTEKHFLVRRFYGVLVERARRLFDVARSQSEKWLDSLVVPLEVQMRSHKSALEQRVAALTKMKENVGNMQDQLTKLRLDRAELETQRATLNGLMDRLKSSASPADVTASIAVVKTTPAAATAA
jgi:hypothetical protein